MLIYSSKRLSFIIIFFLNFLTGIEYAVILPTALQYLQKYGGGQIQLGLCLSAYSFSSLFSSPIMGRFSDKTNNTKLIMLLANLWQIAGNLMYFMGINTTFIICGRLVAGVGLGVISCTFSDVIKTTSISERSPILSKIMIGRQIGMILGPAINFILIKVNVNIGSYLLNNLSAPGFLMALAWTFLELLVLFFYKNLNEFPVVTTSNSLLNDGSINTQASFEECEPLLNPPAPSNTPHTANSICETSGEFDNELPPDVDEIEQLSVNRQRPSGHTSEANPSFSFFKKRKQPKRKAYDSIRIVDNSETVPLPIRIYDEYIQEEVVAVYATTFVVFFMQTCLETFLTPFTRDFFGWTDLENSVLYGIAGLEIMLVFVLLSVLSRRMSDRVLLIVGLVGNIMTLVFLIVYLPVAVPRQDRWFEYAMFAVPVFGNIFSLPFIVLASISLLSKITSTESQGLTQGIRRTVVGLACILGPNWSGAFYKRWYLMLGPMIGLLTFALLITLLSFKHLKPRQQREI